MKGASTETNFRAIHSYDHMSIDFQVIDDKFYFYVSKNVDRQ